MPMDKHRKDFIGVQKVIIHWNGPMLKTLRKHLSFRQRDMADVLGVQQQTIDEWESGEYRISKSHHQLLDMIAERCGFRSTTPD